MGLARANTLIFATALSLCGGSRCAGQMPPQAGVIPTLGIEMTRGSHSTCPGIVESDLDSGSSRWMTGWSVF